MQYSLGVKAGIYTHRAAANRYSFRRPATRCYYTKQRAKPDKYSEVKKPTTLSITKTKAGTATAVLRMGCSRGCALHRNTVRCLMKQRGLFRMVRIKSTVFTKARRVKLRQIFQSAMLKPQSPAGKG